jgi:hypothetical protein
MAEPYNVHITTTADEAGAKVVKEDLRDIREESDAINAGGAQPLKRGVDYNVSAAEYNAARRAEMEAALTAEEREAATVEAERLAIEERRANLVTQRQIIADLELEQTQAAAAGDTQRAAILEIELNIRKQALQLQISAALSEEEATANATQRVAAEQQIAFQKQLQNLASREGDTATLATGINLGKARVEATTFARELASGASTTRTLGSLVGALGPTLGIASLAAYVIYENFHKVEGAIQAISDGLSGLSGKGLAEEITRADQLRFAIQDAEKQSAEQLSNNIEKAARDLTLLTDQYREALLSGDAKASSDLVKKIAARQQELDILRDQQSIAHALEEIEATQTAEITRRQEARKRDLELQKEGTRLGREFQQAHEAGFTDEQKVAADKERIASIRAELQQLGVTAETAAGAYDKSIGPGDAERQNRIKLLAIEWEKLGSSIDAVAKKLADQSKSDATAGLAERVRLLREADKLNPRAGYGAEADRLAGTKTPQNDKEAYFRDVLTKDPGNINAQMFIAAIDKQKADSIKTAQESAESAVRAIVGVGASTDAAFKAVKAAHEALQRQIDQHATDIQNLTRNKADRNS